AKLAVSTAVVGALALGAGTAFAQAPEAEGAANSRDIVVTAQRRSERLLDVPMSVTALTADTLEKSGVANTADLAKVTPGLTMTFYGANLQPSMRGVSATGGNTGDNPSVAMYVDGVYQAQQISGLFDLPDVEQIEILKGPQGTLYGQNATGGAIIVNTRAPSFEPMGKLSASYGNYSDIALRGFVSGPLVADVVAVSVAGSYENREGFRRNISTGTKDRGLDSKLVRGKLLIQPSDAIKLTLSGYYSERDDSTVYAFVPLNDNSLGYALRPNAPRATRPSRQFVGYPDPFINSVLWGGSLRAEFELEAGTISWVSAYAKSEVNANEDLDASPVNISQYRYDALFDETKLHEVNFVSRDFGALSFLVGGLYLKTKSFFDRGQYIQYPDFNDPNFFAKLTLTGQPLPTPFTAFRSYGEVNKEILAAYAEATVHVTDQLTLTAGGRYTREKQSAITDVGFLPAPIPFVDNPLKWSKFTPRLTARYELTPTSNVYATYAKGFKGGLINTGTGFLVGNVVDPEVITSYEIGYKGRPIDEVTVTFAAYRYDYKNLQVVAYGANNTYITQNAASTRGKGAELDLSWAATPEFRLSGGLAYTDAKYRRFPDAATFVPTGFGGNTTVTADLSGRRLLRAPKWTANVSANYEEEIPGGTVGAFASFYYNDGQFIETSSRIFQPAYATVDAEVSFAPSGVDGLRLVLWGKNLTDADYMNVGLITDFADAVAYAEPRTYGARVEFSF
ncbi:MAG TPA: TonB-dependent receptor, partial [Novosphingobium sp.]|nr:TonB-dependent receptor [Novosphingobium sp.]